MRRRDFVASAATLLLPRTAFAQQAMPVIGFLSLASPIPFTERVNGFRRGLKETGYTEGENITIEYRWAEGQYERLPAMATELVRRPVAVLATSGGSNPALAAKAATTSIPIVFVIGEDPVKVGLVKSLPRPDGNLTGVNFLVTDVAAKRLELLRALIPSATRIAVLVNPASASIAETTLANIEPATRKGLQFQIYRASSAREIDAAFAEMARARPDALFVSADGLYTNLRAQLTALVARYAIPTTYASREIAHAGGLMSYGPNAADAYRQAGIYVGRILQGAKPADLPVVQSTRFDLVVNRNTARMLGLTVPTSLMAIADEVIE